MGMPVKLSDELVQAARAVAQAADRSITAQIEHWAKLGRAAEAVLPHADVLSLKASFGSLSDEPLASSTQDRARIRALLRDVAASSDRRGVVAEIRASGRPVYEIEPGDPMVIVEVDPEGRRRRGHFEGRRFVPVREAGSLP